LNNVEQKTELDDPELGRAISGYKMFYIGFLVFFGLLALVSIKDFITLTFGAMVFCGILMIRYRLLITYYEFLERLH